MPLFLPQHAWLISCTDEKLASRVEKSSPRARSFDGPCYEVLIDHPFNLSLLKDAPGDVSVQECWYFTGEDPVDVLVTPRCRDLQHHMGSFGLYYNHEEALRDLADVYEPVRLLLELRDTGPSEIRELACAILDDKRTELSTLANALDQKRHPAARVIRQLSTDEQAVFK